MFRITRKPKPVQTPIHPLSQFATVLTAEEMAEYEATRAKLIAAGVLTAEEN